MDMNDRLYDLAAGLIDSFYWNGILQGAEHLPAHGPAVFVGNHLDAAGPIAAVCALPIRLYPWIKADMVDKTLAPAWLRQDFTSRQLHLPPPFDRLLAAAIAFVTVPLFRSLGFIPVWQGNVECLPETLDQTLCLLLEERFVLVFPEDNLAPHHPQTGMQPFLNTFARLGEMYYNTAGRRIPFFPIAAHPDGIVRLGKPVLYDPLSHPGAERRRISNILERDIARMYLDIEASLEALPSRTFRSAV